MGRKPCCPKEGMNRGAWTAVEDKALVDYIEAHGEGKWRNIPKVTGLKRCGKSCRLRWLNYLRPGIKRGNISEDEEDLIIRLHRLLGNRWSLIAGRLPGRTDNEIKNYWNSNLAKKEPGKKQKRTKYLSELIKEDNKEKNASLNKLSVKTNLATPESPSLMPPPQIPKVKLVNGDAFVNRKGTVAEYESSDISSSQSLSPEVVPDIDLSGILDSDFSMFGDLDGAKGTGEGAMGDDWSGLESVQDIEFLMSSEFGTMASQMNGLFNSL